MRPLPLGARLSLLFAACSAAVSLLAGIFFNQASEAHFVELDQQQLEGELAVLRGLLDGVTDAADLPGRLPVVREELAQHPELALRIVGGDGRIWFDSLPERQDPAAYRSLEAPLEPQDADGARLIVRLNIAHHRHFLDDMQRMIWLGVGLSALATALLGAWVVRRSLRPLQRMGEVAAGISASSLTTRLEQERQPAELAELAQAFNAMLARLEDAFARLSAFSGDIAHELRTPLSNLLTQTQVILSRPRTLEDYREALHSNLEELQRLAQMVADMLLLAKADHGLLLPNREPLELAAEIDALLDYFAPLAEDAGVCLERRGAARLAADRGMLRRALSNLLDNALRFTPAGGEIRLELTNTAGSLRLEVGNSGPAIPAEQLPKLFDRFYRADPARREGSGEHAGLGLALTRSIVRAHGGEIRCESREGWTRFILEFPAAS
ncbi:heavy metal sensor histidine kinase [Azotobacter salinestris]|uniref:heavy metal sensor histidine kinase n=1 Tax=Azotobacter salinestris TaxID=69964 RepID=UPI0032DF247E